MDFPAAPRQKYVFIENPSNITLTKAIINIKLHKRAL